MYQTLALLLLRRMLGFSLAFFLFYTVGSYLLGWPFPTPADLLQIALTVAVGLVIGTLFGYFWPLPEKVGFERIVRTLLVVIPALGIGLFLQAFLQGAQGRMALYLICALTAWLSSGFIRKQEKSHGT